MTRESVDLPAPLAPRSAWVTPGRNVRLAPTSARVCAKLFEIARASRSGLPGSVIVWLRTEAGADAPASTLSLQFVAEHGLFDGRQDLVDVLARGDDDRNGDRLFRGLAIERVDQGFARLLAHEIGLLHARGDDLALLQKVDELRNAIEGGHEKRSVTMARLDGAKRAKRRLVSLDEHGLHVRIGGQHVLGELERFVGGVGLHLLQARLVGEPGCLHRVTEPCGPSLAVLGGLRNGYATNGAAGPALVLERGGKRLAHAVRALIIVGDDERDI